VTNPFRSPTLVGYGAAMGTANVLDEPVRGQTPPPWFHGLSGVDRMRAWSTGLLPPPPTTRLTGSRTTHVGPGSAVCVMPASQMLVSPYGQIEIWPLLADALHGALLTAVGAGQVARVLAMSVTHFRPARAGTGNLVARARVLNASSLFAYAEALIEDNEGRQIAHGGGQAAIITLESPPPSPPSPIEPIEQPTWATPDPWQRPAGANVPASLWDTTDGKEILQRLLVGSSRSPLYSLFGLVIREVSDSHLVATIPASEWFCAAESRLVSSSIVAAIANMTGWTAGMMRHRAGETLVGLDASIRFFRQIAADGRPIRAEVRRFLGSADLFVAETTVYDADENVVAISHGSAAPIDNTRRRRSRRQASERALCTILFTDIVDSTKRAEALGDRAWHTLLEQHNDMARREITRCGGLVVKSTGDGLLARFGSPARALDCAVHLRDALAGLGIQIRTGLHTGECETTEDDIVGVAVNLAARIQAAAGPAEVLVSSTVKDLAAGSGHRFESRGEHTLKGVEEPWRLWAVS
jgi:uncharacterized protein (TIGR00369 family)